MNTGNPPPDWLAPVESALAENGGKGVLVVLFPEYRPDLVKALAHHFGLDYFDFRAEVMAKFGADAGKLDLDALTGSVTSRAQKRGVALMNAEALLAVKPAADRRNWLHRAIGLPLPHPAVIPLAIFCNDVPIDDPRVVGLSGEALPEQSLLGRLAN